MEMTAAVLYGREDVRIERTPVPEVRDGEVRVRVKAATTCGTDVKVWRRGYHANMIRPPAVFGHEFAGVIDRIGAGVRGWKEGDRVVAANSAPCFHCFYCDRHEYSQCQDLLYMNGAYAEYVVVPARIVEHNLLPVPDNLAFEYAALTEPLACVVHGMHDCNIEPDEEVAIIGDGPIALFFTRLCVLAGARVTVIGANPQRLESAVKLGAHRTIYGLAQEPSVRDEATGPIHGGRGFDVVVECVGQPVTWAAAVGFVRKCGLVNLFGGCPSSTDLTVATERIHYDEITIRGTYHHDPSCVREALSLLANGQVPGDVYVQQRVSLAELPHVLPALASGSSAIKIAVLPELSQTAR